jgi:hypothetical protein
MRDLWEEIRAEIHNLFEKELALFIDLTPFFSSCGQLN